MSNKVKVAIVALIIFFLALGAYAKQARIEADKPMFPNTSVELRNEKAMATGELEVKAIKVCSDSYQKINGALERGCGQLADELACDGRELFNDGQGNFWTEANFDLECERNW